MKKLFTIDDDTVNKISFYHLACFVAALPFHFFYSQLLIISFAAHTFIHLKKYRLQLLLTRQVLLPTTVFFIGLLSILYSDDKSAGLNISGRQSAIFFMPVLLTLNQLDLYKYKMQLLKIFAFACTVVIVYLYADTIRTILFFHLPLSALFTTAFINHNFSLPLNMHATYLAVYCAFAAFTVLYAASQAAGIAKKIMYSCCALVLFLGIFQLSSRAVFAAVFLIVIIAIPVFLVSAAKRITAFVITLLIAASTFFIITKVAAFKMRYVSELKNDLAQTEMNNEILEPRTKRWQLALELIQRSPVIGYGNGVEVELMKNKYFENRLYISYLKEFNVHSQYLSFLIKAGLVGLVLYLFVLYTGFTGALKKKNFLFFVFMMLITVLSFSENMLDVNKGIFFYGFFMSFFLLSNNAAIFYKGNHHNN
jgi:O-antigen ligase